MTNTICLDEKYSTTRLLCKIVNDEFLMLNENEDNSEFKIKNSTLNQGGLRTKGYFKKSYEDKPLISIITVVYNGEKYLEETIQSVINQTYDNVEYIIIDGGSTDGTLDIIKKYEDRIDYWVSERDKGIYDAMNKGIKVSSGYIIGIVNADDYLYEDTLLKIVDKFVSSKCDYTYGSLDYIDEKGNQLYTISSIGTESFKHKFFNHMPYLHPTMFIKKSVYEKIGLYDTKYKIVADYDFVLRLLENNFKCLKLDFITGCFRVGGVSGDFRVLDESHKLLLNHKKNKLSVYLNIFMLKIKYFIRNYR